MKSRRRAEVYYVTLICDLEYCSGECISTGNEDDNEYEHECVVCGNKTMETKVYPCTEVTPIK